MSRAFLRRSFFEPIHVKMAGSVRIAYWNSLEKSQWYNRSQLEEIQWNRMQDLWRFLWRHNEFYIKRFKSFGLSENSLSERIDIASIPILTKREIRDNTDDLISSNFAKNNLLHFKTGGSTGRALDVYLTEECSEMRNACARRHDRWAGWEPGEPIAAVWGNPKVPKTFKEKLRDRLVQPYIYLDTMEVTEKSVRKFVAEWQRAKPKMLFGHAHSIFILAQKLKDLGIRGIKPVGILSTSMMLLPHERNYIEEVFGVRVTDRYGCEEVSLIGSECEMHDGLHMNIEHLLIEFVKDDGSYAVPGESGHIVVTDLMNRAMPLVRYRVEDIGVPLDRQCSCGRGMPLMGRVTGRVADFLVKQDGTSVAGISLIENTLTKLPGLDQLQIVQEDVKRLCLNVVPGRSYTPHVGDSLVDYFEGVFGRDVRVELRLVEGILPEKSGKYRFSICKVVQRQQA